MEADTEMTIQGIGDTPLNEPCVGALSFDGCRIYLGPTKMNKGLRSGMGFRGGLPAAVKALCGECRAISELIVAPEDVAATQAALLREGSEEAEAYAAAEVFLNGGRSV